MGVQETLAVKRDVAEGDDSETLIDLRQGLTLIHEPNTPADLSTNEPAFEPDGLMTIFYGHSDVW